MEAKTSFTALVSRFLFPILFCFIHSESLAQTEISGWITDKSTKKPIPFASIGVQGTTFGTVCDEDGIFKLLVKTFTRNDSLKVAAIGYRAKTIPMTEAASQTSFSIELSPASVQLREVVIKPGKTHRKVLGNRRYNTNTYCYFTSDNGHYKGAEAAIKANNKKGRLVWIDDFNFCLMKNDFKDSVTFRLNFYSETADGLPNGNILLKPIIFKTNVKQGVVKVDLTRYNITTNDDFFISLECLEDNMQREMLSFSGSLAGPSFFKMATFDKWYRSPFMGLDFNVTVSYHK